MDKPFDWEDIRLFLAIAEGGSFGKAASNLGISQPTISRRLDQLEKRFGTRLFNRSTTGAELTDSGKALLGYAEKMAAGADAIEKLSATTTTEARGRVKVRLPDVLASCVMVPRLKAFLDEHPNLQVVLDFDIVSLDDSSPDLSILARDPEDQTLLRVPLCWAHYSAFGSADYLEAHGLPETMAEYATKRLIHHTSYYAHRDGWKKKTEAVDTIVEDELLLVCDSGPLNLQMIKAGVGLGSLPTVVCEAVPELQPLNLGCGATVRLNLYHSKDAEDNYSVSVVKNWLIDLFSPKIRWFQEEFVDPYQWRQKQK